MTKKKKKGKFISLSKCLAKRTFVNQEELVTIATKSYDDHTLIYHETLFLLRNTRGNKQSLIFPSAVNPKIYN